jgi:hypothetical protein
MYFSSNALAAFFAATTAGIFAAPAQARVDLPVVVSSSRSTNTQGDDAVRQESTISITFKSLEEIEITPKQIADVKAALISSSNRSYYPKGDEDERVALYDAVVTKASHGPLPEDLERLAKQELDVSAGMWNGYHYRYELTSSCGCELCADDNSGIHGGDCGCEVCDGHNGCGCGHCKDKKTRGAKCDCRHCTDQAHHGGCGCNLCGGFVTEGKKNAYLIQWERQFCEALLYEAHQGNVFDCSIDLGCDDVDVVEVDVKN